MVWNGQYGDDGGSGGGRRQGRWGGCGRDDGLGDGRGRRSGLRRPGAFFAELESSLGGKKVALFGSHEWNEEGQWMDDWSERAIGDGAVLCGGMGLKIYSTPDEEGLEKCRELGKALASM